jgi:hypothetical protein
MRSQAIRMLGWWFMAKIIRQELNGFDTSQPRARLHRCVAMLLRSHGKETLWRIS